MNTIFAFYLWPPFWIDSQPSPPQLRDARHADEEVGRFQLSTGIVTSVRRDGMVVFDFNGRSDCVRPGPIADETQFEDAHSKTLASMQTCMKIMNAYLAFFWVALHEAASSGQNCSDMYMKTRLNPNDLVRLNDLVSPIEDYGGPHGSTLRHAAAHARQLIQGGDGVIDLGDGDTDFSGFVPHRQRDDIPAEVIADSMRRLDMVLANDDALVAADLILLAEQSFDGFNYPVALLAAWAVAEKGIATVWERYLAARGPAADSGVVGTTVNAARRRVLLGRDYTASIRIETLSLLGEIDDGLYGSLTAARKARNAWIHGLAPVASSDVYEAIRAAVALITRVHQVDLQMGGGGLGDWSGVQYDGPVDLPDD